MFLKQLPTGRTIIGEIISVEAHTESCLATETEFYVSRQKLEKTVIRAETSANTAQILKAQCRI